MSGTKEKVVTLKDVKDDLNQILDRLSAIEIILNDPLHGIDFPENVKVDVGEQPNVAGIESFDGTYDNMFQSYNDNAGTDDFTTTVVEKESWDDETTIQIKSTSRGINQ